jgi:hypothetical protein
MCSTTAPWTTRPPNSPRNRADPAVARQILIGLSLMAATVLLGACASTGNPSTRPSPPESKTLQHIEVDGSVRVRANHYRGR